MKNPTPEEHHSKTFAFLVIIALILSILMRGVNTRFDVPYVLYIAIAVISGVVSLISYFGFIYYKIFKPLESKLLQDMLKITLLGVMAYFTVSFSVEIISNL